MSASKMITTMPTKCSRCHREGHVARDCKVKPFLKPAAPPAAPPKSKLDLDDVCSVGSTAASTRDGKYRKDFSAVVCFICAKTGHVNRDCPLRAIRANPCSHCGSTSHGTAECKDMVCFECGEKGHTATSCPKRAERLDRENRAFLERQARRQAWLERQRRKEEAPPAATRRSGKPAVAVKREESPPTPEVRSPPSLRSVDLFPPLGGAGATMAPPVAPKKNSTLNDLD